jgi:hypothetical protein
MDSRTLIICRNCEQRLRVPVGLGMIHVTCPKCRKSWDEDTSPIPFVSSTEPEDIFRFLIDPLVQRWGGWLSGPLNSRALSLLLGILCLAGAVAVSFSPGSLLTVQNETMMVFFQAGMTGAGIALLLLGAARFVRPRQTQAARVRLGIYTFAAAAGLLSYFLYAFMDRMVLDKITTPICLRCKVQTPRNLRQRCKLI